MISRHTFFLFVLLNMTFAMHTFATAHYCAGTVEYVVRNQEGRLIEALDVEVIRNGPQPIYTLIRLPLGADMTADQLERFNRNKHRGPILSGPPMREMSDAGKATHKPGNIEGLDISTFAIRMGCGLPLVELSLKYKGDVMNLRFVNVGEMDAVLDAVPFRSGTFEIDFSPVYHGAPGDRSRLNTSGLRNGNELLLPWHAKGFALIAAENWKRK
ncbi:MAG TPA: hypothetical protein VFZ23_16890 [Pyrinomonadaceae bacterium]